MAVLSASFSHMPAKNEHCLSGLLTTFGNRSHKHVLNDLQSCADKPWRADTCRTRRLDPEVLSHTASPTPKHSEDDAESIKSLILRNHSHSSKQKLDENLYDLQIAFVRTARRAFFAPRWFSSGRNHLQKSSWVPIAERVAFQGVSFHNGGCTVVRLYKILHWNH